MRLHLRQALRQFRKQPAFSAAAVLVLALGIGANAAVITLVNTLLLKPRPGEGSERLVGVYSRSRERADIYRSFSYAAFDDVRRSDAVFEAAAAYTITTVGLREGDRTRRVFASIVSAEFFDTMGVPLTSGRGFTAEEARPDAQIAVAVIGHPLWQRLGGHADVLGQHVTVNGQVLTIVGVAPRGFGGVSALLAPEVYLPTGLYGLGANGLVRTGSAAGLADRRTRELMIVGRLRPGVSQASANATLDAVGRDLEQRFPAEERDQTLLVNTLPRVSISTAPQDEGRTVGFLFALLLAMAICVLVIACLNLANMLLARGSARRKEIAIRQAIGGARRQIVWQLLIEGGVLSLAGAAGGLFFAYWATQLLVASLVAVMPFSLTLDATPDVRVLFATLLVAGGATLVFGLGPAFALSRADVLTDLREQSSEPAPRGRLGLFAPRHLLVVAQVALSLTLLAAGGLFVRSALNAGRANPGYALDRGVVANVDPGLTGISEADGRATYRRLLQQVRALGPVEAASVASLVAYGSVTETRGAAPAGGDPRRGTSGKTPRADAHQYVVGRDYFRTLGVALLRGRDFSEGEEEASDERRVVIVDEPLARKLWPDRDALGERLLLQAPREGDAPLDFEVVGVVAGTRHDLIDREPMPHVYLPFGSNYRGNMFLHVRSRGTGAALATTLTAVRDHLRAQGDRLPVLSLATLVDHRDTSIMMWTVQTGGRLFLGFGLLALLLAVVGLYAVKAYLVSRRTREIAIRMALGATEQDVTWMVLREGLTVTMAGIGIGLMLALAAGRLAASLLFDVSAFDPITFTVAPMFLFATAALACYLPARRAARIAPIVAVRE